MSNQESLEKIKAWFASPKAYATIRIYRQYGDNCCDCTAPRLDHERFEVNMIQMQLAVERAIGGEELREVDRRNIQIVFGMLRQMYGSLNILDDATDAPTGLNVREVLNDTRQLVHDVDAYVSSLVPTRPATSKGEDGRRR